MKLLTFVTGALFPSLIILGYLFKMMHYPGANAMLEIGMAGIALLSIPLYAIYKYKKG